MKSFLVYVGTYTAKGSEGVYLFRMDAESGELTPHGCAARLPNPTYLALHPRGAFFYAVSEERDASGRHDGALNAYTVDPATGVLTFVVQQSTRGQGPCHVAVDGQGQYVLVSNYVSGSVAVFPIRADGGLEPASDLVQHRGKGLDPERQEGPHAHSATFSPDKQFVFVADLGLDRLLVYRLDRGKGRLFPHDPACVGTRPGTGPRHFAFHPEGHAAYLVNELTSTLNVFSYDKRKGALQELQELPMVPEGFKGPSYAADIHVEPSGMFIYASNRGHDSIAIYRVEDSTGRLSLVGHVSTQGAWPRGFSLDPSARFLLVANQNSDTLVNFRLDARFGTMVQAGPGLPVSMPVCVKLLPAL